MCVLALVYSHRGRRDCSLVMSAPAYGQTNDDNMHATCRIDITAEVKSSAAISYLQGSSGVQGFECITAKMGCDWRDLEIRSALGHDAIFVDLS